MLCGKRIVVQVAARNRRLQPFGERDRIGLRVAHHDAAAGQDHGKLRAGEQLGGIAKALFASCPAFDRDRRGNLAFDVTIKIIARNIELRRSHLEKCAVECAARELGHPRLVVDVGLVFRDLRKDRKLLGFLETAQTERR